MTKYLNNQFSKMMNEFESMGSMWTSPFKTSVKFPSTTDASYEYSQETVETESSTTITESWKSTNGLVNFTRTVSSPKTFTPSEDDIKAQIKKAVSEEDYETAAVLKRKLLSK